MSRRDVKYLICYRKLGATKDTLFYLHAKGLTALRSKLSSRVPEEVQYCYVHAHYEDGSIEEVITYEKSADPEKPAIPRISDKTALVPLTPVRSTNVTEEEFKGPTPTGRKITGLRHIAYEV